MRATFEFDWQFLRLPPWLSLGAFATVGFWNAIGVSLEPDDGDPSTPRTVAADKTAMTLLPFSAGIVLRIDVLPRKLNVPLVPFVKGGFDYVFYFISGAGHLAEFSDGGKAVGGIPGFDVSFGLMLQLDMFEPSVADSFDDSWGVNNSFVFFEWQFYQVDGFGKRMILRDATWNVGLAIEF